MPPLPIRLLVLPALALGLRAAPIADPLLRNAEDPAGKEPATSAFLSDLAISLRPTVCRYDGAERLGATPFTKGALALADSSWRCETVVTPVAGDPTARDITMTFAVRSGVAPDTGVAACFDFAAWSKNNCVLIPASVYGGNRLRTVARGYGEGLADTDYYRKDLPLTQGELPRLEIGDGLPSKLEVSACNAATPAVCVFAPAARRGFILLAEQAGRAAGGDFLRKPGGEIRDSVFTVAETGDRTRATVAVGAPGVRARKPGFIGFGPSADRGITLKAGDTVTLRLRAYDFPAADIPAVLAKFMSVRKALTGPNRPRALVPADRVEKYMTGFLDRRYLGDKDAGFYRPENGDWIAFGWIGGWIDTFPMLASGDPERLERVAHTFDFGFRAQEPSGYFHYAIRRDGDLAFREPRPDMNLSRALGDTLGWMIKQFDLLTAQGRGASVKPAWEAGVRKLADAFVATWKREGEWGKMVNVKTGAVSEYGTTGGASVIRGLAYASVRFKNPEYLRVAAEAADLFYARDFTGRGFTTGGCADILQNADSETASALAASLMALYEVTGDMRWLDKCRRVSDLVATWVTSYDYELPANTELGALGAKLAGAVWASTQNKHGAPGICTDSGDYLFKLYRATGDTRYAELLRDIVAAHGESLRPDGHTNERLTYCDADSRGSRGRHVTGWNETNGALMALEIPGIHVRVDTGVFYVFDAVTAREISCDASGVKLEIGNPTKFDARVSVFAEDAARAARPSGWTAFLGWPKVAVKAGETKTVLIAPDGTLREP